MIHYKYLDKTSIQRIHETFVHAFSDYQIKMDLPIWKFKLMLKRRGYTPELSMGVFNEGKLIGFILNGLRSWNGKPTVYDLGTGIIPEYRNQGITKTMFQNMKEALKQRQIEEYLLEVIKSNTLAVQLYKKQGFDIGREFICFKLDKDKFKSTTKHQVENVDRIDLRKLTELWDFKPSWQNSIESINAVGDEFVYSIVRIDDIIGGYGIIDKKTGDIPQISVNKEYRGNGIGRSIVTDLIKNTESNKISVLNVDSESKSTKDFLLNLGFECWVSQYEMYMKI